MTTVKVSDLIVTTLAKHGINTCFSVTGGGSMHLNHSFSINERFNVIYNHHEQASSIAAESFYRLNNNLLRSKCHIRARRDKCYNWRLWGFCR